MDQLRLYFRKFSFPALLTAFGLGLIITALAGNQNSLFIYGGLLIFLIGVFTVLLVQEIVAGSILNIVFFVLLPFALVTAFLNYRSIQEPLEFEAVKDKRYEKVKQKLLAIKEAEIAYKNVYGMYTNSFDTLGTFFKNDSFPVVKAIGNVPDSLTEQKALELGIISRDTIMVSVYDSLSSKFKRDLNLANLDSMAYVPFAKGAKFSLESGEVERGKVKVPVFEASVKNEVIFADWDKHFYQDEKDLQVGSMTDPITNANW